LDQQLQVTEHQGQFQELDILQEVVEVDHILVLQVEQAEKAEVEQVEDLLQTEHQEQLTQVVVGVEDVIQVELKMQVVVAEVEKLLGI
jgi:hypothetical protein